MINNQQIDATTSKYYQPLATIFVSSLSSMFRLLYKIDRVTGNTDQAMKEIGRVAPPHYPTLQDFRGSH